MLFYNMIEIRTAHESETCLKTFEDAITANQKHFVQLVLL